MEAIFFAVDVVGIILVLYWAIINDDHRPGSPTTGLFAYRETLRRRLGSARRSSSTAASTTDRPNDNDGRRPPLRSR